MSESGPGPNFDSSRGEERPHYRGTERTENQKTDRISRCKSPRAYIKEDCICWFCSCWTRAAASLRRTERVSEIGFENLLLALCGNT